MQYKFALLDQDYSDFATGRVLLATPGATGFPVRLASEIFLRALNLLPSSIGRSKISIYDFCCGTGALITTLGLIYGNSIKALYGSDFDSVRLEVAERNVSLLRSAGLESRSAELRNLYSLYGKPSHSEALNSAERLVERLKNSERISVIPLFQQDILSKAYIPITPCPDIIIADIPYGQQVQWNSSGDAELKQNEIFAGMDRVLSSYSNSNTISCIVSRNKIASDAFTHMSRVDRFKTGKRYIYFFKIKSGIQVPFPA